MIGAFGSVTKELLKGLEDGGRRMSGEPSNYNIIEIGLNTEKSPGDLCRRTVTQTPVKDHRVKLMRKNLKE